MLPGLEGKQIFLVDSGRGKSWKRLGSGLNRLGATKDSAISLVLTHCHFDHAENAAMFKKTHKASIIIHKSEGDYLKNGDNPPIGGTILVTKLLTAIANMTKLLARLRYKPADFDISVDEKWDLKPFGFSGYILH